METNLDSLINAINQSKTAVISFYLFSELGMEELRRTVENLQVGKDEEGYVYFHYQDDAGYYINQQNEIYREEPDEGADSKFEVRQEGALLMELRLYSSSRRSNQE